MAEGSFSVFKNPDLVNITGEGFDKRRLRRGNQGFDPGIQIGDLDTQGNRSIFADGTLIGATSGRNVMGHSQGFGSFMPTTTSSSTGANNAVAGGGGGAAPPGGGGSDQGSVNPIAEVKPLSTHVSDADPPRGSNEFELNEDLFPEKPIEVDYEYDPYVNPQEFRTDRGDKAFDTADQRLAALNDLRSLPPLLQALQQIGLDPSSPLAQMLNSIQTGGTTSERFRNWDTPDRFSAFLERLEGSGGILDDIDAFEAPSSIDKVRNSLLESQGFLRDIAGGSFGGGYGGFAPQSGQLADALEQTGLLSDKVTSLAETDIPDLRTEIGQLPTAFNINPISDAIGGARTDILALANLLGVDDILPLIERQNLLDALPGAGLVASDILPRVRKADLTDALGSQRLTPDQFLGQVGEEDLARSLGTTRLTPDQFLGQVGQKDLAKALGSQRLSPDQFLGPVLPQHLASALGDQRITPEQILPRLRPEDLASALGSQQLTPDQFLGRVGEKDLVQALGSTRLRPDRFLGQVGEEDLARAVGSTRLSPDRFLGQVGEEDLARALGSTRLGADRFLGQVEEEDLLQALGSTRLTPDQFLPDINVGDLGLPDVGVSDLGLPDVGVGDLGLPSLGVSDLGLPDVGIGDLGLPSLGVSDLGLPDIGIGDLGFPSITVNDLLDRVSGDVNITGEPFDDSGIRSMIGDLRTGLSGDVRSQLADLGLPQFFGDVGAGGVGGQLADLRTAVEGITPEYGGVGGGEGGEGGEMDLSEILKRLDALQGQIGGLTPTVPGAGGIFGDVQDAIRADLAGPETAAELREDPLTKSILADLEAKFLRRAAADREQLSRFGVIRGGDTIDLANLRADDQSRAELSALSDSAERARLLRTAGITAGTDLGRTLSDREIARAELTGVLGDQQTLDSRQADLDVIGSIIAALDPAVEFDTGDELQKGFGAAMLEMLNLPPHIVENLRTKLNLPR